MNKVVSSLFEKLSLVVATSRVVAPSIVGTARRNENSVDVFLLNPRNKPPKIDAPARETPGIILID